MILTIAQVLFSFLGGVLLWSLAEWVLHNFHGHKAKGKNEFSREHLRHHAEVDYFAPTHKKVWAATKAVLLLLPIAMIAMGIIVGGVFVLGFIGMYIMYEVVHRRSHTHGPTGWYSRWVRKHHFTHHFTRPNHNHGVTSPIWDMIFRTHTVLGKVRVPAKHAMVWLVDPATGEVWDHLKDDYELTRRGSKRKAREAKLQAEKATMASMPVTATAS